MSCEKDSKLFYRNKLKKEISFDIILQENFFREKVLGEFPTRKAKEEADVRLFVQAKLHPKGRFPASNTLGGKQL